MKINLTNMNILVTGASRGIGKGIAEGLGHAGARVAVHFNRNQELAEELVKKIGNDSKAFQADLQNPDSCIQLFDNVVNTFEHLDVLVNNAGVFFVSPLESESWLDDWNNTMDINLRATGILSN